VLLAQLNATIDAGVNHDATSKRLVGVECDFPSLTQLFRDLRPIAFIGVHLHEASGRLKRPGGCREPMLGQQGRHQSGFGGGTGVKRFGHRAELFAQSHWLRSRNAERHLCLIDVKFHQACTSGRSTQCTGRAGDMPSAIVVIGIHRVAHSARNFNAQDHGIHQLAATVTFKFSQCLGGRGHGASGMNDGF